MSDSFPSQQAPLSSTTSWSLLRFMSIQSVTLYHRLVLCLPVFLLSSIFPRIRVFSNESVLHIRWPKHCSFSNSPSKKYSGSISFRIDWFDLLAVLGTLKSLLQHHRSINSSVLSLLCGPTLTSIHDYWKNHSFASIDLYRPLLAKWCLYFLIHCLGLS